jgi:hypothetical protein
MQEAIVSMSEASRAMQTLSVAWNIVSRHPNHPRYRDLLEDVIEKAAEVKANAESLLEWDSAGQPRPELMGGR